MRLTHPLLALSLVAGAAFAPAGFATGEVAGGAVTADEDGNEMDSLFIESFDGTLIDVNICRPASATAEAPVPMVITSHGWGGAKTSCLGRTAYFKAGIGFVSMTQRGNGESTGYNRVMDPDFEGRDIMAVLDHVAALDWVAKDDGPGGVDPIIGGLGGSYGGGFQWVGAFADQYFRGAPTRFNSLRPGNTWFDLRQALMPQDVLRTLMVSGLYAAGARSNNLDPEVHAAMAAFVATGQAVDGPAVTGFASEFHQHSAAWFVEQGEVLDIPIFVQQGADDQVFNLNEGIDAYQQAITPAARERSFLINHHGGHSLPANVPFIPLGIPLPQGPMDATETSDDTCDAPGDLEWFKHTLLGEPLDLGARMRLRTDDGTCLEMDELPAVTEVAVAALDGAVMQSGPRGELQLLPLAEGAMTLAGAPTLSFTATTADPDARLFWGLAVGTSADDARLIGGQWMPTRVTGPALDLAIDIELGAIVTELQDGETLFLTVTPAAEQYAAHVSRTPGALLIDTVTVGLPLVD